MVSGSPAVLIIYFPFVTAEVLSPSWLEIQCTLLLNMSSCWEGIGSIFSYNIVTPPKSANFGCLVTTILFSDTEISLFRFYISMRSCDVYISVPGPFHLTSSNVPESLHFYFGFQVSVLWNFLVYEWASDFCTFSWPHFLQLVSLAQIWCYSFYLILLYFIL